MELEETVEKNRSKCWSRSGLDSLLKRIDARANADRAVGSGRPRSARTSANRTSSSNLSLNGDNVYRQSYNGAHIEHFKII